MGDEPAEKLRLLGKLAATEDHAQGGYTNKNPPNWADLERHGQIPAKSAAVLADLDLLSPEDRLNAIMKNPEIARLICDAIAMIQTDGDAVRYLAESLTEVCRWDSRCWDIIGRIDPCIHVPCFRALERNWKEERVNDTVGILLCGLQVHKARVNETSLVKAIVDPKILRMSSVGRIACLAELFREDRVRVDLCNSSTVRSILTQGLCSRDQESLYQACICLWMMSFNKHLIEYEGILYHHRTLLDAFIDMVSSKVAKKEKIIRAICLVVKNLLREDWICDLMLAKKVDHVMTLLEYERWRDPEIMTLLAENVKTFCIRAKDCCNFSRFMKELDSGILTLGPVHTEKFWATNFQNFEENEFEAVQKLAALIADPKTPHLTLQLALFDLGEFVRLHPMGRIMLRKFNAKQTIVECVNHPNKEVAREALLTTQKMMLDDWRRVGENDRDKDKK